MSARIDFEKAKQHQLDWMHGVRLFLNGTEKIDKRELTSNFDSKLGKWYYSSGKDKYGSLEPIKKFEVKQIKQHKIAKEILEAKEENHDDLAEELYEDLVANSQQIIDLLDKAEHLLIKDTYVSDVFDESLVQNANKAVAWDKTKILTSKTDSHGIIEYVNDVFLAISGYESAELIDKSHNVVRHPDMPKVVFKMLWDELKSGNPINVIVKNKAKSGKFYWVTIDFKINKKSNGEIESYSSNQKGLPVEIVKNFIEPLYKKLIEIEETSGEKAAENFLKGFLEERNRSFDDYVLNLLKTGRDTTNTGQKGFLGGIFG